MFFDGFRKDMAESTPLNANEFIEQQLDTRLKKIGEDFDAHAISVSGPLVYGLDDVIRSHCEQLRNDSRSKESDKQNPTLVVILTTDGGQVDVVQRIVETIRHHYSTVEIVVPNSAYSAGTVLAMSGDSIHMDYYSRLGPIDPQVQNSEQRWVPALGYLKMYERLVEKAEKGKISPAEVNLMIDGFDQATLYAYEQAKELSRTLLEKWLVAYKFKDWKTTETHNKPVDDNLKKRRAGEIAEMLNDTDHWHVHGRGITRDELVNDVKLKIDDFGKNVARKDVVREYHSLLDDYLIRRDISGMVHKVGRFTPYL